ncbi:MAG: DsbA family protein [Longimicrobiales bacterium]|nr:DsbA family protein [Longimicrobiales bacterium]
MEPRPPVFFFDYLDPLSYLVDRELASIEDGAGVRSPRRVPLELRPPPAPLLDPDGPEWGARWALAGEAASALGVPLLEPPLLPWTRKAHELVLHAAAKGLGAAAHQAVFEAVFLHGKDVGRVDVLVGLAQALGMDAMEAKVVLDVDRWAEDVAALRHAATEAGVAEPPALVLGSEILRGFHNRDALRTFLLR